MRVLFLAAGYDQRAYYRWLHKEGHEVVAVDYSENPKAKDLADRFYQVSTLDEAAVEWVAQKEKVERIITDCTDQALLTMARVSEKLGLPCHLTPQQALELTNKFYMKKRLIKAGVPTARYLVVNGATWGDSKAKNTDVDGVSGGGRVLNFP